MDGWMSRSREGKGGDGLESTHMYVYSPQYTNPEQGAAAGAAGGKKKKKGKGGQQGSSGPKSTRRGSQQQQQHSIPPALQSPVWDNLGECGVDGMWGLGWVDGWMDTRVNVSLLVVCVSPRPPNEPGEKP